MWQAHTLKVNKSFINVSYSWTFKFLYLYTSCTVFQIWKLMLQKWFLDSTSQPSTYIFRVSYYVLTTNIRQVDVTCTADFQRQLSHYVQRTVLLTVNSWYLINVYISSLLKGMALVTHSPHFESCVVISNCVRPRSLLRYMWSRTCFSHPKRIHWPAKHF